MSSVTQVQMRAVSRPAVDVQVLDLSKMLGERGCQLLAETLKLAETGWRPVPPGQGAGEAYVLAVKDGLPVGVSDLSVTLRLHAGAAQVTRAWKFNTVVAETEQATIPADVAETVRRLVGRSVNTALVHTIANQLKVKLQARMQQPQTLRMRQTLETRMFTSSQVQHSLRIRQRS